MASVTIPAGFVKLISHACGARSAITCATRTISGIVRSAKQMPPGPGRLLTEDAEAERDLLVDHATLELTDAHRAEDEVRAVDPVPQVGGAPEGQRPAALGRQPFQDGHDALQARGVDVVQDDLGDAEDFRLVEQRSVDEWYAEAASADDAELHASCTSMLERAMAESHAGGGGSSVTSTSSAAASQTRT